MKKMNSNFPVLTTILAAAALMMAVTGLRAQTVATQPGIGAITPIQQSVETGPILDVVPYVLSDGYTINLALIPSDTEFAGYDNPSIPNFSTAGGQVGGLNAVLLPSVYPKFTVRQVVTTVNVWDNQTVVLGGLVSSQVQSDKDKVPVIGDVPLVGRLFQSGSKVTSKKNLMIFVTATIVDPSGLRVHSDDELPFAQTAFPTQPPGALQPVEKDSVMHTAPVTQ
jgi:general secretion pathway protein D